MLEGKKIFITGGTGSLGQALTKRLLEDQIWSPKPNKEIRYFELFPGDNFYIPPGRAHQMYAMSDTSLFEFSTHHQDSDSYRILKGD